MNGIVYKVETVLNDSQLSAILTHRPLVARWWEADGNASGPLVAAAGGHRAVRQR